MWAVSKADWKGEQRAERRDLHWVAKTAVGWGERWVGQRAVWWGQILVARWAASLGGWMAVDGVGVWVGGCVGGWVSG